MRQLMTVAMAGAVLLGVSTATARAGDEPNWNWLVVTDGPRAAAERETLVRAVRLLPRLPARVAVFDADESKPEVRPTLLTLDAFVVKGSPVIYVVRQSALFRGAVDGSTVLTYALASVVWHEMAHSEGDDERGARKREEELWTMFVRDQRVDQVTALRYLTALAKRPDAQVQASR